MTAAHENANHVVNRGMRSGASTEVKAVSRIALYLPDLAGGGMERSMLHLAEGLLSRGYQVDLVVNRLRGAYLDQLPVGVHMVALERGPIRSRFLALQAASRDWRALVRPVLLSKSGDKLPYLRGLVRYLHSRSPVALLSASPFCNLVAVWAGRLAGTPTRIVVSERNTLRQKVTGKSGKGARWRDLPSLIGCTYPQADGIVAVSHGVAEDLAATAGLRPDTITTIYNPVVTPALFERVTEPAPHPWLDNDGGAPVIVAAGRLAAQKNFPLLLRAFARLRRQRPVRLLIMGEGPDRQSLEALACQLGINDHVALPGFVTNPYAAFARASLFVLSSNHEGLPGVLIQALACGCPVVSTDCPSGPMEILEGGRFGELVPVNDSDALAGAMARTLDAPLPAETLRRRGNYFSLERSTGKYLQLLLPGELTSTDNSLQDNIAVSWVSETCGSLPRGR